MFIVFDLDGTLCDITHRLHYIKGFVHTDEGVVGVKKDWDGFYNACVNDVPIEPILTIFRALCTDHLVEIWTGRSEIVRSETVDWLIKHDALAPTIRMRPANDHQHDYKLKEQWLLSSPRKPDLVFEDREQVVDMWRKNGIRCAQVDDGFF